MLPHCACQEGHRFRFSMPRKGLRPPFLRAFEIGLWFRSVNFLDSVVRTSRWARIRWRSQRQTDLAMNLLLLLALAVPLSCLAFLSSLTLLGMMTLGGVIHVLGTVRARRPQWPSVKPANNPAG